jgi:hypothetical protein
MYLNIVHRPRFGVIAGYANKVGSQLIYSSVTASCPFRAEREFDAVAAMKPRVKNPAIHLVVSLSPNHSLSDFQFVGLVLWLRAVLDFGETQVMVWRHSDTAHSHIHALANRITLTGKRCDLYGKGGLINKFKRDADEFFRLVSLKSAQFTQADADDMVKEIEASV